MEFLKSKELLFCFVIFACKIVEVCLSNVKTILLVKGKRTIATALAFSEVFLWAFVISGVINDLNTNIKWLLAYCLGYTAGYYIGSSIERLLALGTIDVQFIFPDEYADKVEEYLIDHDYGYYISNCRGKNGHRTKVDAVLPRKNAKDIRLEIENICEKQIFTTNYDVAYSKGGYSVKRIGK